MDPDWLENLQTSPMGRICRLRLGVCEHHPSRYVDFAKHPSTVLTCFSNDNLGWIDDVQSLPWYR